MIQISPSLLAADFGNLEASVRHVTSAGANYLHLDVMDGMFVPNISFGPGVISALRKKSSLFFDVHLMIEEPSRYFDSFIKAGADLITVHYEACKSPKATLEDLRMREMRRGIAISPATPVERVYPLLENADMVLIMTVVPGFGGQKLIPETVEKVRKVRRYIENHNLKCDVEVDGGIDLNNLSLLTEAGANVIVAGSAIFGEKKQRAVISRMREIADEHPYVKGIV